MSVLNKISVSLAGTAAAVVIQLGGAIVIARLLTPDELGVFAVAAGAATLLVAFKNFGTSNYLIQCRDVDPPAVGSAFAATLLMSGILGTSLFFVSRPFADFFEEPKIAPVMELLAANFLITPFVTVGSALLTRFQRFKDLVVIEVLAGIGGMVVSVTGAYIGFGALALALATTAHSILTLVLLLYVKPPCLTYRPSLRDVRSVLGFGGWTTGAMLFNQFGARANEFIIAKVLGVGSAAMFDKGASLARLIGERLFGDVLRVLLPVFAEQRRVSAEDKTSYTEYVAILGSILGPLYLFLAFNAYPFIIMLYGEQWLFAVPVASVIAVEQMLMSPGLVGEKLLIADGRVRTLFKVKAIQFAVRLLTLVSLIHFGLVAASLGLVLAAIVYEVAIQLAVRNMLALSWHDVAVGLRQPVFASMGALVAGVVTVGMFGYDDAGGEIRRILFSAAVNLMVWLSLAKLLNFAVYRILVERVRGIWQRTHFLQYKMLGRDP